MIPYMEMQYPIGKFDPPAFVTAEQRAQWIDEIAATPALFRKALEGLDDQKLDTPYRPDGWTVRQVVHQVVDSHINSYTRFRLALTEDSPTIKPYDPAKWAELHDARTAPAEVSLQLLELLHQRWVSLLRSFSDSDFARTFYHPEDGIRRLDITTGIYAWHGRHHAAHITGLRERMGW
jgi:hypothetical protein